MIVALVLAVLVNSSWAREADLPWHASGWSHRALISVVGGGTPGVDVAWVHLMHAGTAQPDGDDLRVFDAQGQPVPYALDYLHPQLDALLRFRVTDAKGTYVIYWGNPQATTDPQRAILNPAPGSGEPKPGPAANGWTPKAGLTLVTMRREREAANPMTVDEMARLIDNSPGLDGAGYRINISDGFNPWGLSDYYVSCYRGWIQIDSEGLYSFCTASNEASFSFLDGKPLIHWPGRHTEQRGKHGEYNAQVQLKPGRHYVEYYHEEVLLYQVAFLGYQPPGARQFDAIPERMFVQPHRANVQLYQQAGPMATLMPRWSLVDSVWPDQRPDSQYTRVAFAADAGAGADAAAQWQVTWNFGNGLSAAGARVEHVFLKLGAYQVQMLARGPAGQEVKRSFPLNLFSIDHTEGHFGQGTINDYADRVLTYDHTKLPAEHVAELAQLLARAGRDEAAQAVAQRVLSESATQTAGAESVSASHRIALGETGSPWTAWTVAIPREQQQAAAEQLAQAYEKQTDAKQKLALLARRIRHAGVALADVDHARELYQQAETLTRELGLRTPGVKANFREAVIAMGDAHLAASMLDAASEDYRTAEALHEPPFPAQVRASKTGAYPEAVEQQIAAGDLAAARAIVDRWRHEFPSDQLRGAVFFYAGQLDCLEHRFTRAAGILRLAIELSPGAAYEAQARWLLAQSRNGMGDRAGYLAALRALLQAGIAGPYREMAAQALKEGS